MPKVADNPQRQRYEVFTDDGELAGFSTYTLRQGVITFLHTEIDMAYEGQGLGSRLVRGELEDARARGFKVVPRCPFVKEYMSRHPDFEDIRA
ncbi:GNAT family N-acetyltransferase [Actinocorallia sp. A-T 12471]|uniref:GNAT family N-acetyltransferase n=1 Tax=Actinocorallia sp. A-T 12471 TaxID=3089813 RepID=UPI0029D0AEF2|nr:GNAT family N-acetyltransferase [Actinocorallia sp. A-T 12471]MDX6739028.1 GNAT family N-acetyltransferase [Actinocorallia sp. A-T 12471]